MRWRFESCSFWHFIEQLMGAFESKNQKTRRKGNDLDQYDKEE